MGILAPIIVVLMAVGFFVGLFFLVIFLDDHGIGRMDKRLKPIIDDFLKNRSSWEKRGSDVWRKKTIEIEVSMFDDIRYIRVYRDTSYMAGERRDIRLNKAASYYYKKNKKKVETALLDDFVMKALDDFTPTEAPKKRTAVANLEVSKKDAKKIKDLGTF